MLQDGSAVNANTEWKARKKDNFFIARFLRFNFSKSFIVFSRLNPLNWFSEFNEIEISMEEIN